MQASRFERLLFDPFSLIQNGFVPAEVDIGGFDVVEALVVVVVYGGVALSFHGPRTRGAVGRAFEPQGGQKRRDE